MFPRLRGLSGSSRDDHPTGLEAKDAQSWFQLGTSIRCGAVSPQVVPKDEIIYDNTANL